MSKKYTKSIPKGEVPEVEAVKQQLESVLENLSQATKDSLEMLKAFKEALDARVTSYVVGNAKLQEGELLAAQAARQAGVNVSSKRVAKKLVDQKDTTLDNLLKLNEQNQQIAKELAVAKIEHAEVLAQGKSLLQKEELKIYQSKMNNILERVDEMNNNIKNVVQEYAQDSKREQQLQVVESAYQSHMRPEPAAQQVLENLTVGMEKMLREFNQINNDMKLGSQAVKAPDPVVKADVEKSEDETISRRNSGP